MRGRPPSGSVKWGASSTVMTESTWTVRSENSPTPTGPRLGTVTAKSWATARPSVSVAVTVTVVRPFAIAVTSTDPPTGEAAATAGSPTVAV